MIGDIAAGVIIFVILGALVGEIWFTTKMMVLEKINEGKGEVINTGDLMYANEAEEKWLLVVFYQVFIAPAY